MTKEQTTAREIIKRADLEPEDMHGLYVDIAAALADARRAGLKEADRTAEYRDRFARRLQLDHTAKQMYCKTDIIIALDQIEGDMEAADALARKETVCPVHDAKGS